MDQICDQNSRTIVASSASLGWEGVSIARGQTNATVLDQAASLQHHFCMIVGNQVSWECSDDGKRMKALTTYPGQICIYPADILSSRRITMPYEFIALMLAPEKVLQGLRDVPLKNQMEFRVHHNVDDPQLQGLMHTFLAEAETGNPNGRLFVESLTLALSIHFVKQYAEESEVLPENRYSLNTRQLRRILDYIEDNLAEEISLEALAQEIGLSKYYFCRLFKQSTGQPPYQYVLQRRLDRAKALLQHGEINIIEVAHFFGFSDQSHFSRLFKKSYGITPGNFLKDTGEQRN